MQAFDMIKIERSKKKYSVLTFFLLLMLFLIGSFIKSAHAGEQDFKSQHAKIIVIDPGHGGYDHGARGSDGNMEKDISLLFARIFSKELKPDYQVVFTRNDDYPVNLKRRASIANHSQADIFISIHTGGGSRDQMDAWSIFYYKEPDREKGGIRMKPGVPEKIEDKPIIWGQVQLRSQKKSQALAGCMKTQLVGNPDIREVTVSGADLRVLEGLDMPAIIIETGYLTNPKTEKQLNSNDFLTDIAKRLKKGVDVYLTR